MLGREVERDRVSDAAQATGDDVGATIAELRSAGRTSRQRASLCRWRKEAPVAFGDDRDGAPGELRGDGRAIERVVSGDVDQHGLEIAVLAGTDKGDAEGHRVTGSCRGLVNGQRAARQYCQACWTGTGRQSARGERGVTDESRLRTIELLDDIIDG
jgi:hypothetical protein